MLDKFIKSGESNTTGRYKQEEEKIISIMIKCIKVFNTFAIITCVLLVIKIIRQNF